MRRREGEGEKGGRREETGGEGGKGGIFYGILMAVVVFG